MKRSLESLLADQREVEAETLLRAQIEREERAAATTTRRRTKREAEALKLREWIKKYDEMGLQYLHHASVSPPPVRPFMGVPLLCPPPPCPVFPHALRYQKQCQ